MTDVKWPFRHIRQDSVWPWHRLCVNMAVDILNACDEHKQAFTLKTIERCIRLGAKLAVEFEVPPCLFMDMAEDQIIREGGEEARAHLAMHMEEDIDPDADIEGKNVLTDLLADMGATQPGDKEPTKH